MKIICIGQNYQAHNKEMSSKHPENPVFFLKPDTALLHKNRPFFYPDFTKNLHYEAELVIKINRNGKSIEERFAHRYYNEIAFGLDMTARDLQKEHKEKGLPWEISKAFDNSAPLSPFIPISELKDPENIRFSLKKNSQTVQQGSSKDMIFSIDKVIAYLSKFIMLKMGDVIFTGTPAGVGPLTIGDKLEGFIEDRPMLRCDIK